MKERTASLTMMSLRVSLDRKYEYDVGIRAERINIVLVANSVDTVLHFGDVDAIGKPRTVAAVRRPGGKYGRRMAMTAKTTPEEFDLN